MMESRSDPSILPPDDAIHLTEDGGVCKLVVREGNGDTPPLHSRCIGMFDHLFRLVVFSRSCSHISDRPLGRPPLFKIFNITYPNYMSNKIPSTFSTTYSVHYVGLLADSGNIFMDTKEAGSSGQPVTVVAGRGTVILIKS